MRSHRSHYSRPYSVHSENRDTPPAKRLREHANKLEQRLLSAETIPKIASEAGFGGSDRPHRLSGARPSTEARHLAHWLAESSLEPLRRAFAAGGATRFGNDWNSSPPHEIRTEWRWLGVPLLAASSAEAIFAALHMFSARGDAPITPVRDNLSARLTDFLMYEDWLWDLAAAHGGPSRRIPYPFAFDALECFWSPAVHILDHAHTLCLRCGLLVLPKKRAPVLSPPRCSHCAKEPLVARAWPPHAIAPAERGTWWLRCLAEGCTNAFVGRAQTRRCMGCRASRITATKRTRLRRM